MEGLRLGRRAALAGLAALGGGAGALAQTAGPGAGPGPGAGAGAGAGTSPAGAWPNRPVTVVVPWPAGGSTDTVVRVLAPRIAQDLGQPVLVDNRTGASGTVGHLSVARARPDGYTLLVGTNSTFAMAPHLMDIPYDHDRAFAPLGLVAFNVLYLCVHPSVPARSLAELVALARAQPGKLTYASAGAGSSFHLAMEMLLHQTKADILHVPYRGGAPATQALVAGEVQISCIDAVSGLPFVRSGDVRILAVTGDQRTPLLPQVPTVAEALGLPGFRTTTDFAMFAPAGTPEEVLRRIHQANLAAVRAPEVRGRIAELGMETVEGTPEGFAAYYRRELAMWGGIIREKGIRAG
ncbi:tripartite tricarboxylate transporter substrate binding protein [Paracraurococcus ruber]|uniref:Bug family tripartite tricarboxylate transporter substrate binding protein n=1 Tax=Paracraurococcus ruber TaxID=77675 RepID=UPI00105817D8|nr:tripartite tricarboxylate transporter substrate binding protein [Paracraurococcus ruber]TDG18747.1 tripartite tricarboxylate transporter substrate binding protein [Paracraurococcus ruber]